MIDSDEEVKKRISEKLARVSQIDVAKIRIEVKNGKVTLTGSVPTAAAQSSANWITTAIPAVTAVINHLTVRRPATQTMATDKKG